MGEFHEESGWRAHLAPAKHELLEKKLGPAILGDMKVGVPVDTGELRDSLDFEVIGDDTLRVGSKDKEYAGWVEDGHLQAYRGPNGETVYTGQLVEGQPYMKPALFRERGDV